MCSNTLVTGVETMCARQVLKRQSLHSSVSLLGTSAVFITFFSRGCFCEPVLFPESHPCCSQGTG